MSRIDLVFFGGGAKGMVFAGALEVLFKEAGHSFGRLLGTSARAITAVSLAGVMLITGVCSTACSTLTPTPLIPGRLATPSESAAVTVSPTRPSLPTRTGLPPTATATATQKPPTPTASPTPSPTPTASPSPSPALSPATSELLGGRVEELLVQFSLPEKIGQMLMVTILGLTVGQETQSLLQDYAVGGIALLEGNVQSPLQVQRLTAQLQQTALQATGIPLFIAVDHEGGIVSRFRQGVTELPANMALGATRSLTYTRQVAQIAAAELRGMGLNVNLAPVLDVNDNALNPVIGLRSFGEAPDLVASLGTAYIQSLQQGGVIATAKHFPGHGSTAIDSHYGLPVVTRTRAELEQKDLVPFRAAIEKGVGLIMTGHIALPALHNGEIVPATLSSRVLDELLRRELGYEGVIITDDMGMRAIADRYGAAEAAVQAVQAGADIVLIAGAAGRQIAIQQALLAAAQVGTLSAARIDASVRRILYLKLQYGLFAGPAPSPPASIGAAESLQRTAAIADKAVTLVQNAAHFLPASPTVAGKVLVVSPNVLPLSQYGTALGDALRKRGVPYLELVVDLNSARSREAVYAWALQSAPACDWLLIGTWNADAWQTSLVRALCLLGKPVVVVAFGTPYDLTRFPEVTSYLAVYGKAAMNAEAAAKAILGEIVPAGLLPVTIPGLFPYGWRAEP